MKLATLCYVRQGGKTLMMHRIKKKNDMHQGKWNGLGGKFEPGETPEDCASREIFEESGLQVRNLELKGLLTFPGFANDEDWYAFVFVAHDFEGELIESPEGVLSWIDDDKLNDLELWDGDRVFIKWLEYPEFFSAKFNYIDGKFLDYQVVLYNQGIPLSASDA
jgi:8-oxo-dGTP diphosphatase